MWQVCECIFVRDSITVFIALDTHLVYCYLLLLQGNQHRDIIKY